MIESAQANNRMPLSSYLITRWAANVTFRKVSISRRILCAVLLLTAPVVLQADWLTFAHDPQRSGWASEETKLSPANAKDLDLKWSIQLDNAPLALNALTAPVVARDVATLSGLKTLVYVGGSSNHLFAVEATTGVLVWQRTFQSFVNPRMESFF